MEAKLHLIQGKPIGKVIELPAGTFSVGRSDQCNLIIASSRISRRHCEFINGPDGLVLRDLGSRNGTLVNHVKIQEYHLEPGDQVQIGLMTFQVEIDGVCESVVEPEPEGDSESTPMAMPIDEAPPAPTQNPQASQADEGALEIGEEDLLSEDETPP